MENNLKILMVQIDLVWEDAQANLDNLDKLLDGANSDLVILPEMFSTGFTMNPAKVAQSMSGSTVEWMKEKAAMLDAAICGSIIIVEGGNFYNRMLFVYPTGEVKTYDKRHLFSLAGEEKAYSAGRERLIVQFRGWKICPLVCYDLRFPVFSRNDLGYDLVIYVANWPEPRISAWDTLLSARAIENMAYCIGVNRVGVDANSNRYPGHSQVVDFLGNVIKDGRNLNGTISAILDKTAMTDARGKFGFLNDRDQFTVN